MVTRIFMPVCMLAWAPLLAVACTGTDEAGGAGDNDGTAEDPESGSDHDGTAEDPESDGGDMGVPTRFQTLSCTSDGALPSGFSIGTSESYEGIGAVVIASRYPEQ